MLRDVKKYHILMRLMHWLMAVLIICMICLGWYMSDLPKEDPLKGVLVGLHKSFGVLLLVLFLLRVVSRVVLVIPPLPDTMALVERRLAHVGHGTLYILMAVIPLSGYAMSNMYGYGVSVFGLAMPKLFPANKELAAIAREAHELLPYVLLVVLIIHVAAVIKHRFFDKPENNVLGRML